MIDVSKLSKAAVLAALYNNAHPQGIGALFAASGDMTEAQAAEMIGDVKHFYVDYLKGRVMKVEINGVLLDPRLYDRDNGEGAAARALAPLLTARAS